MRIWAPLLLLAGCMSGNGDDDADDRVPACASDLFRAMYDGSATMVPRGTVSIDDFVTARNAAELDVLIDGPEIFPAFRELIASAQHDVVLQTYVWEVDTDPANEILAGLRDLAARRAVEAPDGPPVAVRFLFDVSTLDFGSAVMTLPRTWASVEALGLDPRHVTFEIAGFFHLAFGNLHVKTVVVDGERAIVTGANPQAHHDYAAPWRDAGYRMSGDIARALEADFRGAWLKGQAWTCGAREDVDPD